MFSRDETCFYYVLYFNTLITNSIEEKVPFKTSLSAELQRKRIIKMKINK